MTKLGQPCISFIVCMLTVLVLPSCHPSPRNLTLVSGKTVYGDMALEDVHIQIHRWEEAGWHYLSDSNSGYHGSFRIHLPAGEYRLTASKTIRVGEKEIMMTGLREDLKVERGGGRIDQVLILMLPSSEP